MALSNESDEYILRQPIQSKEDAMAAWQQWLRWGENDNIGAGLIGVIASFGLGDPEIIDFLESCTSSGIAAIRSAASIALTNLANQGDVLALFASRRYQQYGHERFSIQAKQEREFYQKQADAAGLSLTEFCTIKEQKRVAQFATSAERRQELAMPSQFQPGQRVQCLITGWPHTGAFGTVERAVTKYFVVVRFDNGYRTIQSDSAFKLLDQAHPES
ncbi:hypothetical protein [Alkalinema sp. FACHB-956]|uniref:hypothetical protein n=1 Tax=Alkalinema sp. FACHB-956 TaxID=2692768 RepID=UPI001685034E|nr:hypothetical protein [Alkalinema sp. FACHB-956]MBD2326015.1 hypothetical protein [Alkalinema sp. FACHB-956]